MTDQLEPDFRDIERARDLPPDERGVFPAPDDPVIVYGEAINCVKDALSYLEEPDPEAALQSLREAIVRIEAAL